MEGKDVIGIAQTGTGKTLAFGIPMIKRVAQSKSQGLILVPTRELAAQVDKSLRNVAGPIGLRTAVVMGGVSQHRQVKALKKNPHIVIATPGRLADLMDQGIYKLNKISVIALDEADRMLDVGFLPQMRTIFKLAPKDRQTLLFSATMPKAISKLAAEWMKMPLRVEIAPQGTSAKNVEQELFIIKKQNKMRLLDALLDEYKDETTLVFSRTKHGAKKIARQIRNMGHTATEINGNRSQAQRTKALKGFSYKRFRVMVATDIAARGIDVRHISLVINYDLPDNSEDYVHRIGRTGRAGRSGKAISFATPDQKYDVKKIQRLIRKTLPILDIPELPNARPKPPKEEFQKQRKSFGGNNRKRGRKNYGTSRKRNSGRPKRSARGQAASHPRKKNNHQKNNHRKKRRQRNTA